jgi:hypothetical protein
MFDQLQQMVTSSMKALGRHFPQKDKKQAVAQHKKPQITAPLPSDTK